MFVLHPLFLWCSPRLGFSIFGLFLSTTIGASRIIQLFPQDFSGVTEVKFRAPANSLRISGVKDGVILPKRDKTRWCNFSWQLRLLNPQKLFGVIGGVIITPVNSWKRKWGSAILEVRMVLWISGFLHAVTGRRGHKPRGRIGSRVSQQRLPRTRVALLRARDRCASSKRSDCRFVDLP